jgi:hypothetical protein
MTNDLMTTPLLLSPQSCSFLSQSSSLGPYHLFADVCVGLLNLGQSVRFKANGWSMHPTICDGEIIHVEPVLPSEVKHRDIILYKSPRGVTAHRVVHIQKETESVLSPQPSVKLSGHWVIRLLGHFWVSLSLNLQRRTPNALLRTFIKSLSRWVVASLNDQVIGLLGYGATKLSLFSPRHSVPVSGSNSKLRTPNSELSQSAFDSRPSTLIFYTRGDSLTADDFPVMPDQILGKVFSVERNGRTVALYGNRAIMLQETHLLVFTLKRYVVHALSQMKGLLFRCKASFKTNTIQAK